jgi:hypothetical protein
MNTWDAQEYHRKEIINLDVTRWLHAEVHKVWNTSLTLKRITFPPTKLQRNARSGTCGSSPYSDGRDTGVTFGMEQWMVSQARYTNLCIIYIYKYISYMCTHTWESMDIHSHCAETVPQTCTDVWFSSLYLVDTDEIKTWPMLLNNAMMCAMIKRWNKVCTRSPIRQWESIHNRYINVNNQVFPY